MTSEQQPLFQDERPEPASAGEEAPAWLQRTSLIILVLFCFYIGAIMVALPWIPKLWIHNGWLVNHPALHMFVQQGWFRGVVSGVGLLDIWIGISEAMHFREQRRYSGVLPTQGAATRHGQ